MLNKRTTTATATETETEYTDRLSNGNGGGRSFATTRPVTQEQIARRAYEIYKSGTGGTPEENWYRAERELRARA